MIRFDSDYLEGAHPKILEALIRTNFEQTAGYGNDDYCKRAGDMIRNMCGIESAYVQFCMGGTQANSLVIDSILRPHQGVICAKTAHIAVHETGAVEATGHKVLTIETHNGKITAQQIIDYFTAHWKEPDHEHIVQPGMVYISHPTEAGTLYTKKELKEIYRVCQKCHMPLYLDGARLSYGLTAPLTDVTITDIADNTDVFYIGGTKCGTLFGEAVVFTNQVLAEGFRYIMKQHGALLAKGRVLGIQFLTLLEDNLYYEIASHANKLAMKIRDAFTEKGCDFLYESNTNQQFPIIRDEMLKELEKTYVVSHWAVPKPGYVAARFCTSWGTKDRYLEQLIEDIHKCG